MHIRLPLLVAALLAVPAWAEEKIDTAKIEEQARVLGKAFTDADWGKLIDMTHPRLVEAGGGKDKMIEQIEETMKRMKAQGFAFKDYKVGKCEAPVTSGMSVYVVVPTSLELTGPGSKIQTDSYLLAVSDDGGKSWKYVDGAGLADAAQRAKLFPDLPKDLKLPERKPPKVSKE